MNDWPTNSEQHGHMRLRQAQNLTSCLKSEAEDWMASLLAGTEYVWTRQAQWGFRLFDFWCPYIGVAIEVDGPEHDHEADLKSDAKEFDRSGIVIRRIPNFDEEAAVELLRAISTEGTWNERREILGMKKIKSDYSNFRKRKIDMNSPFSNPSGSPNLEQAVPDREKTNSDKADTETPLTASDKAAMVKFDRASQQKKEKLEQLAGISSLDWKQIPPPMLAQMLVNMPFRGGSGEPDFYLEPWQAMVFALRCYELGLSPFSNEVWFNPKNNKVNVTFEGKLKLARKQGLNLGPPRFERVERGGVKGDYGYRCRMTTSKAGDEAEYTAWFKEWNMPRSPVWKEKPDHMLQLRAAEKCLSFASGIGSSELMGEQDLTVGVEAEKFIEPSVGSTEFVEVPMNESKGEK